MLFGSSALKKLLKQQQSRFPAGSDSSVNEAYPLFAPGVSGEVINWHFDALSLLQLPQDVDQQLKVEGIGVVEVVLVFSSQLLLFFI